MMRFRPPLVQGTLVRRWKRFLAEVRLEDGRVVTAHCPNPGAMTSTAAPGRPVWISRADGPKRKLRWTWQLSKPSRALVLVNTHLANGIVRRGIERGRVPELAGYDALRPEVVFPDGVGRVDLRLESPGRAACWVEVKSVTLRTEDGGAAFPDSVTARGTRHLEALERVVRRGERAALLFLVGRADTGPVRPAETIDPVYARTLRSVTSRGVEVLAYRAHVRVRGITLGKSVPVVLDGKEGAKDGETFRRRGRTSG